jgi:hypothetical protein
LECSKIKNILQHVHLYPVKISASEPSLVNIRQTGLQSLREDVNVLIRCELIFVDYTNDSLVQANWCGPIPGMAIIEYMRLQFRKFELIIFINKPEMYTIRKSSDPFALLALDFHIMNANF